MKLLTKPPEGSSGGAPGDRPGASLAGVSLASLWRLSGVSLAGAGAGERRARSSIFETRAEEEPRAFRASCVSSGKAARARPNSARLRGAGRSHQSSLSRNCCQSKEPLGRRRRRRRGGRRPRAAAFSGRTAVHSRGTRVVAAQHGPPDVAGGNSGLQGAAVVHGQRHPEGNHLAQGVREKQRLVLGLFLRVVPARLDRLRRRDLFSASLQGREADLRQDGCTYSRKTSSVDTQYHSIVGRYSVQIVSPMRLGSCASGHHALRLRSFLNQVRRSPDI